MARGDQLARQWRIIQRLSATRRGKTVAELAEDLDCHLRTVYRDLQALEAAGFPVCAERTNGTSRWSLLEGARGGFSLPVTLPELLALHLGRGLLKGLVGTIVHGPLDALLGKIKTVVSPEALTYIERIEQGLRVGGAPRAAAGPSQETLDHLSRAAERRRVVELVYHGLGRNRVTRRCVEPYSLWFFDGTFYLIGRCRLKKALRLFAVNRIRKLEILEETYPKPGGFDPEVFMHDCFGVFNGERVRVRVQFAPEAAGFVREKIWHPSQRLYEKADGSLVFEAEVAGTREIKLWVLRFGAQARVLEPRALAEEICAEAASMLATYAADAPPAELSMAR